MTIRLTERSFVQELKVDNRDDHTFEFTTLFHTYFAVNDIKTTKMYVHRISSEREKECLAHFVCSRSGLNNVTYLDKVDGGKTKTETNEVIEFSGETDRVYKDGGKNSNPIVINNRIQVTGSSTMPDIVVWNPWQEKAKAAADIGEHNYPRYVCVEVGGVKDAVKLDKNQSWNGAQEITLLQ